MWSKLRDVNRCDNRRYGFFFAAFNIFYHIYPNVNGLRRLMALRTIDVNFNSDMNSGHGRQFCNDNATQQYEALGTLNR